MNSTRDTYTRLADRFGSLLPTADASAPTPCAGWDVGEVVRHNIDTQRDFLARHGLALPESTASDLVTEWVEHTSAVAAVLGEPGVAERSFDGHFGPTTVGETLAEFYGFDLAVHGWDVARATGQPWPVDDEEALALRRTAEGWGSAIRAEGVCGPEVAVADGASAWEALLGFVGRDPGWAPTPV